MQIDSTMTSSSIGAVLCGTVVICVVVLVEVVSAVVVVVIVLVVDVLVEEVVTVLVEVIQVVLTSETIGSGLPKLSVSILSRPQPKVMQNKIDVIANAVVPHRELRILKLLSFICITLTFLVVVYEKPCCFSIYYYTTPTCICQVFF